MNESFLGHMKQASRVLGLMCVLTIFVLIVVEFVLTDTLGLSMSLLSRDPAVTYHAGSFIGVISNIGIILWSTAVAVCLFCLGIFQKQNNHNHATFFIIRGF